MLPALVLVLPLCLPCAAADDVGDAIYAGDTVEVIKPDVEFGLRDKTAVVLGIGQQIRVTEVRDQWLGGTATVELQRHSGWVRRDEVKLVAPSVREVVPIQVPQAADDPQVVQALASLGVKLERNDRGQVHSADATESQLDDAAVVHLSGLHQLAALDLSGRPIHDEGIRHLAGSTTLQELYLDKCPATDDALAQLKEFPNLEALSLRGTQVRGPGLVHLQQLKHLQRLNLSDCQVGDEGLALVEPMVALEVLALAQTKVTGAGLKHVKPLTRLITLNLIGCDVDDDALHALYDLEQLRMLYVERTKVTEAGMEEFREYAPSLAIFD